MCGGFQEIKKVVFDLTLLQKNNIANYVFPEEKDPWQLNEIPIMIVVALMPKIRYGISIQQLI